MIAYRNKEMRTIALQDITQQMNIEKLTHSDVKNKSKALRTAYYLEVYKIQKYTRSSVREKKTNS